MTGDNPYRQLPSVDELAGEFESLLPWPVLTDIARATIAGARNAVEEGRVPDVHDTMRAMVRARSREAGTRVINATGVLLHTNLGRAPWSTGAAEAAAGTGVTYTNLELSLDTGGRGSRGGYVIDLLTLLTGAQDALVVNNNAGAILLALAALSPGRAVPVARGELIEIGGAYRLPDVMSASGARLVEVGTTNRTRRGDYETALQLHDCGAVLKVHPSNYSIDGFTEETSIDALSGVTASAGVYLIHDIGSGLLDATTPWLPDGSPPWLRREPGARQSIEMGADLVTFSGDKLLGGPQAGIVVGAAEAVAALRDHPLARALRVDGTTLAALGATLSLYAGGEASSLPFWQMATMPAGEIRSRAALLRARTGGIVRDGDSAVGAGSAPGASIPSSHLVLEGEDHLFHRLLDETLPILARRDEGALILDLRTVLPEEDDLVGDAILRCR